MLTIMTPVRLPANSNADPERLPSKSWIVSDFTFPLKL